jgi:hypothetical protein
MLLEAFGTFDAPQRHEQQREQTSAQSIESRPERAIDFLGTLKHAAEDQNRHGQEYSRTWNREGRTKQRSCVLQ